MPEPSSESRPMTAEARGMTIEALLVELGPRARLITGPDADLGHELSGACIFTFNAPASAADVLLVVPEYPSSDEVLTWIERLPREPSRVVVLTYPVAPVEAALRAAAGTHVVIEASGSDPASVVVAVTTSQELPDDAATRRLTSLQRSLTQVLGEREPIEALLDRVKGLCNATAALVDRHGRAVYATGPLPLDALFDSINSTTAETQLIDVEGWTGVADRIHDITHQGGYTGWLLVTSRTKGFPGAYETSAVHVAAALVEASQRMSAVTRQQERAIRAAVLEEALALVAVPAHSELSGRVASLGLTWSEEMRAVVVQPLRSTTSSGGRPVLSDAADLLSRAFDDAAVPHLVSRRERSVTFLLQGSPATVRRAIISIGKALPSVHVGVGRPISSVGEVPTSFHDAQLAVQSLRRTKGSRLMSYEDFDFATRLFSDVGAVRMTRWARDFLAPLDTRDPLLEGLRLYFQHGQNMNAAADALSIHHNSLRYRLAKAEELLQVNLRDPGAVASVFLALAALELEQTNASEPPARQGLPQAPRDIEAPRSVRDVTSPSIDNLGVVYGPDRV